MLARNAEWSVDDATRHGTAQPHLIPTSPSSQPCLYMTDSSRVHCIAQGVRVRTTYMLYHRSSHGHSTRSPPNSFWTPRHRLSLCALCGRLADGRRVSARWLNIHVVTRRSLCPCPFSLQSLILPCLRPLVAMLLAIGRLRPRLFAAVDTDSTVLAGGGGLIDLSGSRRIAAILIAIPAGALVVVGRWRGRVIGVRVVTTWLLTVAVVPNTGSLGVVVGKSRWPESVELISDRPGWVSETNAKGCKHLPSPPIHNRRNEQEATNGDANRYTDASPVR